MGLPRALLATAWVALVSIGCEYVQANTAPGVTSEGEDSTGSADAATTSDGASASTAVADSGSDGAQDGGCIDAADCPADGICVGGLCIGETCPDGEACDPGTVCTAGVLDCSGDQPTCVADGPGPPGEVCGDGLVCDESGGCVPCMDGAICEPDNECALGSIACNDGNPTCSSVGWALEGAPCRTGWFCNGTGVCTPAADCAAILGFDATTPSGVFDIDPDGVGVGDAFDVYCDMDTGTGGWSVWNDVAMADLPSNASLPRCSGTLASDCYAGTIVGRGDATGLFRVAATVEVLEDDLTWTALQTAQEHLGDCTMEPATCVLGTGNCLFSFIGDGADCCTAENMNNLCRQ